MNPETMVMNAIMVALSERGCFVMRVHSGVFYTPTGVRITIGFKGLSDLVGFRPDGKFFALETKTPVGQASPEQLNFIDFCHSKGVVAGFANSIESAIKVVLEE